MKHNAVAKRDTRNVFQYRGSYELPDLIHFLAHHPKVNYIQISGKLDRVTITDDHGNVRYIHNADWIVSESELVLLVMPNAEFRQKYAVLDESEDDE